MRAFCLTLLLLCTLFFTPLFAQLSFGVKGGLNYDSFGDFTPTDVSLPNPQVDASTGFHLGVFTNIDLLTFYVRHELQYSKSESSLGAGSLTLNKLEAPVLLG